MNLVRFYQPRYSVNKNLVNEMMNSFLTNDYHENYLQNCRKPAINIFESENDFKIEMMLPGFTREDMKINFHNEMLTIKVDNKETESRNNEEYKYVRREFDVYNFEKQFKVPQSVNAEGIDAKFENGILNIVLPKKEEALEKAPVDIKVL
ncbi:MAG: Hsp20/alpha crystallin family protein [Draconibacterium sp.]